MRKKLLALLLVIAMLITQLTSVAVFSDSGDVVDVMQYLDGLSTDQKTAILRALWNQVLFRESDPGSIDRDIVYNDIKASFPTEVWNAIVNEAGSTPADGKIAKVNLMKVIDKVITYKPVFSSLYSVFTSYSSVSNIGPHLRAALNLPSSATDAELFDYIISNHSQPMVSYNGSTFIVDKSVPQIIYVLAAYMNNLSDEAVEAMFNAIVNNLPASTPQSIRDLIASLAPTATAKEKINALISPCFLYAADKAQQKINEYVSIGRITANDAVSALKMAGALKLATPVGVSATPGDGYVTVSWSAVPNASFYRVSYGTAAGTYSAYVTASGTSITISGLSNGVPYYFAVEAGYTFNANNRVWSSMTSAVSATPYSSGGGVIIEPTPTPTPTATVSPTPTPSDSPEPSATPSPEPSVEPSPSASPEPSASPKPTPTPIPGITPRPSPTPTAGTVVVEPEVEDGKAVVEVDDETIKNAVEEAPVNEEGVKEVKIALAGDEGASQVEAKVPASLFAEPEANTAVVLEANAATVSIPSVALQTLNLGSATTVSIEVNRTQAESVIADPAIKEKIGDKPVIDINIKVDDKPVTWSNESAPVTIGIPYTPTAEELANPDLILIWYIDDSGQVTPIKASAYDPVAGMVRVTLTHMSKYAVVYDDKNFVDIAASWAKNEIKAMAARGVISGTSTTALVYSPKYSIIRADFVKLLVSTLGLEATVDSNFSDVQPGTYYYDYVGIAKTLGITKGDGQGRFNPKSVITREDMMVMVARALDVAGKLSMKSDVSSLSQFTDNALISGYARQSVATLVDEGIIQGNRNIVNPKGYFTREEAAAVMYRLFIRYISPVQ